jgi:NADH:ubiquinone oxidoreductase subunit 6 (subunit J)
MLLALTNHLIFLILIFGVVMSIALLNGIVFTGHQIGGALGIQLSGVLRDLTGSYDLPFTIAALLLFGASLASFAIQEKRYSMRYQATSSAATD